VLPVYYVHAASSATEDVCAAVLLHGRGGGVHGPSTSGDGGVDAAVVAKEEVRGLASDGRRQRGALGMWGLVVGLSGHGGA